MKNQMHSFRVRSVAAVAALMLAAQASWAVEPFTVRDIRVEGLQRVEPGTLFASMPVRIGETYTDEKGSDAIRALYALGLFKDVRIDVSGDVVVVVVQERPTIADVDFSGAKEFERDALLKAVRESGMTEGRPYDKALTDRAEQEIKRQYINRSLYGAEVVTTVTPVDRNRVNLSFAITEGVPARIRDIRIVGNKTFSESTLRGLFDQDTGGWLSWYTKSDRYSRTKLNADLETLRAYYLSHGYIDFKIDSTQVAVSPDKRDISIVINLTEGEQFAVSDVRLNGNYLEREDEFKSLVKIKPGQPYNAQDVTETVRAFSEHFGNFGYAFATVDVQPEIDRTHNRVAFVINADPARRAYVRKINISGNTKTRDEVIRREFRQLESSWYDGDKIRLSRDRVDRLGYFKDVTVEVQEVPDVPDQVDLLATVTEKPTGTVQLGASISTADKLGLTFGLTQENAFGSGNYLSAQIDTSKYSRTFVLSTMNPYFTPDGVSRGFNFYHRTTRPYEGQGGDYQVVTQGLGVKFGIPFTEEDTVYLGVAGERTRIVPGSTALPAAYQTYINQFGASSTALPLSVGWVRDGRDSAMVPTSGRYQNVSGEWSVAGNARYLKASYQFQQYLPINKQYTLAFNTDLGWGTGLGGRPFPLFKNFYSGGLGSVRGFDQSSLGPQDASGFALGGQRKINLNVELITPFPGAGNDRTLRMFGFMDVGNVYGEGQRLDLSDMRASVGLGVSWISPLGPLRFALATPVKKKAGDRIQRFQFQIGTSF